MSSSDNNLKIMIIIIIVLIRLTQFCGMSSTWLRCWTAASTRSSTAPTISQVYIHYLTISLSHRLRLSGSTFMSFPQKGASRVQEAYPQWPGKLLSLISRAGQTWLTCRVEWRASFCKMVYFLSSTLTQHFHFYGDSSTYWIFLRWTSQGTNVSFRQEAWIPDRKFVCLELNEKEEDIIIDFFSTHKHVTEWKLTFRYFYNTHMLMK